MECFNELDGNKAVGIDKVTKENYRTNLDVNLENLTNKLKNKSYKPMPARKIKIPKSNGKLRGIDEYDSLVIKVVGNGSASKDMISRALKGKIEPNSILVSDSKNSYINFAKENNLKLIQIPSGYHKKDNYTINDVNEIMTEISNYLFKKRGISSRHLQHHMNFIRYRKILKYTIEYLKLNENMYVDTLLLNIKLRSNDVYSTDMPFNHVKNSPVDYFLPGLIPRCSAS